jgi:hypothetical protein
MRTSTTDEIDGGPVSALIGRIEAASTWHAVDDNGWAESRREHALRNLIRCAEDIDADAIVSLEFEVDGDISMPETGVTLARIRAKGIAIKLSPNFALSDLHDFGLVQSQIMKRA